MFIDLEHRFYLRFWLHEYGFLLFPEVWILRKAETPTLISGKSYGRLEIVVVSKSYHTQVRVPSVSRYTRVALPKLLFSTAIAIPLKDSSI